MPRAGLTPDRVAEEAEAVADELGLDALSLATVATRLGVRLPSLYKHVAGAEALRVHVAVRAKRELATVLARASVGRSGKDALRAMSLAYRSWAVQHPGRYAAGLRAPDPGDTQDREASAQLLGVVTDALHGYGLEGETAVDAVRALRAMLHGFVSLELAGGFGLPQSVDRSYERLVDRMADLLAAWSGSVDAIHDDELQAPE